MKLTLIHSLSIGLACVLISTLASAETVRIAVATNFAAPMKAIVQDYKVHSDDRLKVSFGSSGKLYAQIVNGAPYEVFLSADMAKPAALVEQGLAIGETRFTYALGRLALLTGAQGEPKQDLARGEFSRLAIANPRFAPYGMAAMEVLTGLGLNTIAQSKLVLGESVSQTFQFTLTGNAQLGFVAMSQVLSIQDDNKIRFWIVPRDLHSPIRQGAVVLESGRKNKGANDFMVYLQSDAAATILQQYGYDSGELSKQAVVR